MAQYFIGSIVVPAGTSVNNLTTAVPFNIPIGADSVVALASGSDCYAEVKRGTSALTTTATAGNGIGVTQYQLPCDPAYAGLPQSNNVLIIFNNNASSRTVQVECVLA